MAAPPSLNQVYISESVLSKGAQLPLKTDTFYLISSPGLSLLFLLRHAAAHLHESFPERSREQAEAGEAPWRGARRYLPSPAFRETGRRRPPVEEHRHVLSTGRGGERSIFKALFACCSVPVCGKWRRQSVIRGPRSAPLCSINMIQCNHTTYRPAEGCVLPWRIWVVCL